MEKCTSIISCSQEKIKIFSKNGYSIFECKACGHRFSPVVNSEEHLGNVYSDDYFFSGKEGYPNYLDEKDILIKHGAFYANIISKYIQKQGTILDVGCAAGFILKGFAQKGWNCFGVEPNKRMVEYGVKEFGFNIQNGTLESLKLEQKFDLITMIQVIGHCHDLDKAIKNAYNLLNNEGYVLVESWNRKSPIARIFGKQWHEYSPPSVIHWFSDKTLIEFFEYYGFKFIKKGLPLKRINFKHAISLVEEKLPNFVLKKKIFDFLKKVAGKIKLIYPPVDVKWYLFKKQISQQHPKE